MNNSEQVKRAVEQLVDHVEKYHVIVPGTQHEFESLVANLIIQVNADVGNLAKAWNQGFASGYSWNQECELYYRLDNYGNPPPEPSNPYGFNSVPTK